MGRVEPKTLTATEVHANHAPLIDTAGAPQQATTDPRRDGGEWRPPPPPCSPRWCPPVARWVPRPSSLASDVPLVWFRSLRVGHSPCARGARSVLCRWWCSSPTSVTSPPPGPSSRGSSLPAPSSPTPPASTTAAMVGMLIATRGRSLNPYGATSGIAWCSSPQLNNACVRA